MGESQDEIVPYTLDQMTALLHAAKGSRNAARWTLHLRSGSAKAKSSGPTGTTSPCPPRAAPRGL